ncbi:MAG: glycosyltransferase family 2 protein [Cetobacterium sp.]
MKEVLITVFTSTYNRAYIIEKLYKSLQKQNSFNFEWLVMDDGSIDNTEELFKTYTTDFNNFKIRYYKIQNGGKPRAINEGLKLAKGKYFFIVDSDDYITYDCIQKLETWIKEVDNNDNIIGVGGAKAFPDMNYVKGIEPKINKKLGYIDATNIERKKFDLDADMNEAYKVDILKKFPFKVWEGEKFSPEEITLNEIALNGYKIRWHKDIICICEYLEDGLTKGNWNLLKSNPMGYAMLYNHKLKYIKGFKKRFNYSCQHIALSIIGKEYGYILQSNSLLLTLIAIPFGCLLAVRRRKQFNKK